jgi:hypothetical protein
MQAQAGIGTKTDAFVFYAFDLLDIQINLIWIKAFSGLPLPTY